MCLLKHYSFDCKESDTSSPDLLEVLLNMLFNKLQKQLKNIEPIIPNSSGRIGFIADTLLVVSGDIKEYESTKTAMSLLNINENKIKHELFSDNNVLLCRICTVVNDRLRSP